MKKQNHTISIAIATYNEENNIPLIYDKLYKLMEKMNGDFEILFINDGSKDKTLEVLKDFATKDKRTLTVVLRMMTEEMLEKLITDKENSLKLTSTITQEETEIAQYGSVLTTDQRGYF